MQILLGISELHKHNIIYRDLKPENILMEKNGYVKLTDFGVSKIMSTGDDVTNTMVGTLEYMAPELIKKEGHGKTSDWWSFGVFL